MNQFGIRRRGACGCCLPVYDRSEFLRFNYDQPDTQKNIRCRERGEYYIDSYNDQPRVWTFGTGEEVGTGVAIGFTTMLAG